MAYPADFNDEPWYLRPTGPFPRGNDEAVLDRIAEIDAQLPDSLKGLPSRALPCQLPTDAGANANDIAFSDLQPSLPPGPTGDYLQTDQVFAAEVMAILDRILRDLPAGIFADVNATDPLYNYNEDHRRLYMRPRRNRLRPRRFRCVRHNKSFQSRKDLDRHLGSRLHPESIVQHHCPVCQIPIISNIDNLKRHLINQHGVDEQNASEYISALR